VPVPNLPKAAILAATIMALWCSNAAAQVVSSRAERHAEPVVPQSAPPTRKVDDNKELEDLLKRTLESQLETKTVEEHEIFLYNCKNMESANLKLVLEQFVSPSGTVAESPEKDSVIISDIPSQLKRIREIVVLLDTPVPHVQVETRLVEFTIDSDFEKQINLAIQHFAKLENIPNAPGTSDFVRRITEAFMPSGALTNTQGMASWSRYDAKHHNLLSVFLKFLERRGRAKILSAPNLILRRGMEGSIITGEEVPIQTQTVTSGSVSTSTEFKSVGIKLRVTPVMIGEGKARLKVNPEVSNVTRIDISGAPIIAIRNANTELDVLDGQLISMGGLFRNEERELERRVPILSRIPLLGHFFRGKERQSVRSQLVIFLSVRILDQNQLTSARAPAVEAPKTAQDQIKGMDDSLRFSKPSIVEDLEKAKE
jgi:general secretion pathway protein D